MIPQQQEPKQDLKTSNMNRHCNVEQGNLTGPTSRQRTTGILVTVLLLERDAFSKTTDRRKQYLGDLLTVLEELVHDYHGRQPWHWSSS